MEYRNSPLECDYSLAQLLMGRHLKSILPATNQQLKPSYINHKIAKKRMQGQKINQKENYDKRAKSLPILEKGDECRVQFGKVWKPAIILDKHGERSYKIQTEDGAINRRNRRYINRTRENIQLNQATFPNILHPDPLLSGDVGKGFSQNGSIQAKNDDSRSEVKATVFFPKQSQNMVNRRMVDGW